MAASAGSGLGIGTLAAGAAVVAVAGVVGYSVFIAPGPDADPVETPQGIVSAPDTDAPDLAAPNPTVAAVDTPAEPPAIAPRFDLVRVDAAGGALIAGQAEGNAELRLRLDGQEIHLASSDASGDFVAMFDIPPSELPRVLSLEMLMEDGSVLISDQSVIISPTLRPATGETGVAVASVAASGPETPANSGVTDLALSSGADSPPTGGMVPLAPTPPDLPEQAASASTAPHEGDAPEQPALIAGLDSTGADQPPMMADQDAAGVVEIASAVSPANGIDAPTRGLSPAGQGSAEAAAPADESVVAPAQDSAAEAPAPEAGSPEIVGTDLAEAAASEEALSAVSAPQAASDQSEMAAAGVETPLASGAETVESAASTTAPAEPDTMAGATEIAEAPVDHAQPAEDVTDGSAGTALVSVEPDAETIVTATAERPLPDGSDPLVSVPGAIAAPEDDSAATAVAEAAPSEITTTASETAEVTSAPVAPDVTTETAALATPPEPDTPDTPAADTTAPVLEAQAPTILLADAEGIRVMQSGGPGPQVQAQVTLDTIAYDTVGAVVLTGRGRAESDVRFYLDNQPIHLAQINLQGGWRTQLPQVDPGTYTLRLDEVSADGAVQSRIETPFLREEPSAVAAITSASGDNVITVQWGNTLWGIAQQHLGEGVAYVQIYQANRDQIRNPDLIYPGQIFTLPERDN